MITGLVHAEWELLVKIVVSFFAGALIGLEREKAKLSDLSQGLVQETPGVRSFGFISLIGTLTVTLPHYSLKVFPAHFLSASLMALIISIIMAFSIFRLRASKGGGFTTPVAMVIAYAIGIAIGLGLVFEGIALSIFTTFTLAVKLSIERVIKGLTYQELLSALEIGIIVFLLGPFLAKDMTDPFLHIINIKVLYIFFVIVLLLSYLGYIMVRLKGPSALDYFAFFGGLVHSEATVMALSKLAADLSSYGLILKGVLIACSAMMIRNFSIALIIMMYTFGEKAFEMAQYFLIALIPSLMISYLLSLRVAGVGKVSSDKGVELGKPISFKIAVKAVMLFTGILILTTCATSVAGNLGALVSAFLGGLTSAEATIFAMFTLASTGKLDLNVAVVGTMISIAVAILNKIIFVQTVAIPRKIIRELLLRLCAIASPILIIAFLLLLLNL